MYSNLKKLGLSYLQFIPCINPDPERRMPMLLSPEEYGRFLCSLFDLWYADWDSGSYTSVQLYDDCVHAMCGQSTNSCALCGSCGNYLVIESDGGGYPCDFYVDEAHWLGNIRMNTFDELTGSEAYRRFVSVKPPRQCSGCKWERVCHGGCQRYRLPDGSNALCQAMREFFDYAGERLEFVAKAEMDLIRLLGRAGTAL